MTKRKLAINKKAKREIDKFPLVEIKWLDITSDSSWQDIDNFLNIKYTGYDISKVMINNATKLYPQNKFIHIKNFNKVLNIEAKNF